MAMLFIEHFYRSLRATLKFDECVKRWYLAVHNAAKNKDYASHSSVYRWIAFKCLQ